jgi:hypothetical protein
MNDVMGTARFPSLHHPPAGQPLTAYVADKVETVLNIMSIVLLTSSCYCLQHFLAEIPVGPQAKTRNSKGPVTESCSQEHLKCSSITRLSLMSDVHNEIDE